MSEITCADRVTFTPTGAVGTVLERFERTGLGDLSGEWATVRFDDGETIAVRSADLEPAGDAHGDDCNCPEHRCGGCGYNERTGCNCLV